MPVNASHVIAGFLNNAATLAQPESSISLYGFDEATTRIKDSSWIDKYVVAEGVAVPLHIVQEIDKLARAASVICQEYLKNYPMIRRIEPLQVFLIIHLYNRLR